MYRLAATLILSCLALAQDTPEPEIVRAAKSPYDLARYINSHDEIDWAPLWQALGVDVSLGLACAMNCAAELIVIDDPAQAILIVNASLPFDVYLRFAKEAGGAWRVTGKYYANVWDGTPHRHEIVRAGDTLFLLISTHGAHGSDIDEEMEVWIDLSIPSFEPVFSYSVRGHSDALSGGISSEIDAGAHANSSVEITLRLSVYLSYSVGSVGLGRFEFAGLYTRAGGGKFTLRSVRSIDPSVPISTSDFEDFARVGTASQEQEIRYALPRLKEVAAGKDQDAKLWLRRVLGRADDTPEKRELLAVLAKP